MQTLLRLWRTLEACPWNRAVAAEWQERFGQSFALIKPHLKPIGALATTYPCPNGGGDACPRQVHERDGGFVAVCGNLPAECAPMPLKKTDLAVLAIDRAAVLSPVIERVRAQESLVATSIAGLEGLLPLGILERRAGRTLVVLATAEASTQRGAILELRRASGADAVVVLVPNRREDRLVANSHVELGIDAQGLRLYRALRLLWPESWAARATRKEALFEDVELVFAAEPDKHVVLLNGELMKEFRISDAKFARLLRLAAARAFDPDIENGGWLKKTPHLQLDDREVDLVDLRNALVADQPDGFAGMSIAERKALVQSSPDRPGFLRLPLNPHHIRFDASLKDVRLLGDQQNEPRSPEIGKGKRKTKGSDDFAHQKAQTRAKVLKMFEEVRGLGVPLPDASELRSRSTL
jgi:hypothetical protein